MVNGSPYLPEIMAGPVDRVNQAFSTRENDPFTVRFQSGIISQVATDLYQSPGAWTNEVLVWLVMNYTEQIGKDPSIYSSAIVTILIVAPTDVAFTQSQRDDQVFMPRLIPVYEQLIQELSRERWFQTKGSRPQHTRINRPFWGGNGEMNGASQPNLFKKCVDCIAIDNLQLRVKLENCSTPNYIVYPADNWPSAPNVLVFPDDMELIVGNGGQYDPVDGETSIVIPALVNRDFNVYQRGYGKLRDVVSIEVEPIDGGGFQLLQGLQFKAGDTYVVKVRPYVATDTTGLSGSLVKNVSQVFIGSN